MRIPKPYKFFDHTADVLFEATGKDFPQALENAALAMFDVTCKLEKVKARAKTHPKENAYQTIPIHETADSRDELLASVLSRLVGESDASELFFTKLYADTVQHDAGTGRWTFEGRAQGVPFFPEGSRTHVKAVTRSSFTTVEDTLHSKTHKPLVKCRVLLDI